MVDEKFNESLASIWKGALRISKSVVLNTSRDKQMRKVERFSNFTELTSLTKVSAENLKTLVSLGATSVDVRAPTDTPSWRTLKIADSLRDGVDYGADATFYSPWINCTEYSNAHQS